MMPIHMESAMRKTVRSLRSVFVASLLLLGLGSVGVIAQQPASPAHRLAIQVDTDNVDTMNLAINNAMSVKRYYDAQHQPVSVEIVTYGPGIIMLRSDTSPVKERIATLRNAIPGIALSMCNNTKNAVEQREGHEIIPLEGAHVVPSGAVRLIELQEAGWSYLHP
jgi:uncharacterized protein